MGLADIGSKAVALSNLILVIPKKNTGIKAQPKVDATSAGGFVNSVLNFLGVGDDPSFLFHYEGENTVTLESDITDHYIEDNTARQDHITLKPEIITVTGYIGELNDVVPEYLAPLKIAADKLGMMSAFTPSLSVTALKTYNTAMQLYNTGRVIANAGIAAVRTFTGDENQNEQQKAFSQFYGYYKERRLFTVQTPWAIFEDMAIRTLRAVQEEDTNAVSSFEISFKKLRFAQSYFVKTKNKSGSNRSGNKGEKVNKGTSTPAAVSG
jgi:hypothetical protein